MEAWFMQDKQTISPDVQSVATSVEPTAKELTPAAQRALAEAAERRSALDARAAELARTCEIDGRKSLDPVRYTDWETKGIATDF
jgi:hypothetical protein